ncbi:MAG: TIR domain-containing protein, partial [Anaerolineae bacterium]|nr:TIR domain-containing protein [Anaerolineae bacterium]
MSHIFISYSRKDITFAKQVVSALEKSEFDVWIDWDNIPKGEDWWSEIQSGVEEADAFLFLLSPDSAASEVCRDELEHALENGKRILPVVLRDISPQDTHSELSKRNWIFCRDGQDNFNQAITEIIDTIHIDYEWLKFHAELQVKALKWQRNNQEKSLLLRGQELEEAEKIVNIKSGTEPQLVDIQRKYLWESRQAANRQRRNITVGTITIALAIIGIILFSYFLVRDERDRALANQVAAVSKNYLEEKLDLALLLAVQASRQDENFQTNDALLLSIQQDPNTLQVMRGHGGIVLSVAFSPDGTRIASGSSDNTIRIWDANSGEQIGEPLTGHSWSVNSVAFSPDGTRIASGSSDNTI